ncbi:hypothetical protein SAMN05443429_11043 [Cruoricaptor ignavus]|uniref:Uncharacterized protein n=1 Tax=Cruoricaptor ignavus TaxID=1118202 RepID=A0A1M6GVK0_9FLAO|nr:hypothetical protein [Cruoricaptor ignavus]SHJ13977.1 hypothetical protein SAMN05443429_11043 [Cruoricaptor ignavus]
METNDITPKKLKKKPVPKKQVTKAEEPKKISKTWEAVLRHKGTGEILDMRAVLK